MVCLAFCRSKSSYSVSHGIFFESSPAWQPVVMIKEQKHSKKKYERHQANKMGAEQRPFGIPGHLCKAAVPSSPLKHVVRIQWWDMRQWPSKMLFQLFLNPLLFFGIHFLLFMSSNCLQMAHSAKI